MLSFMFGYTNEPYKDLDVVACGYGADSAMFAMHATNHLKKKRWLLKVCMAWKNRGWCLCSGCV